MVFSANMLDDLGTPAALLKPPGAELVLQRLFPQLSTLIKNLSKMLQTERAHQRKERTLSMQPGNDFIFSSLNQQDVYPERQETENSIINACASLAPNRQHTELFSGLLKKELAQQTDEQLH